MGIRIIASRFSITRNLTGRGLPSEFQKMVVMKCYPWREIGVHLQHNSAMRCVLLSLERPNVRPIGFIQGVFGV